MDNPFEGCHDMQQVLAWAKDYWVLIAVALLAVIIARFLIRSLMKLVMFAVLIGVILVLVFHASPAKVVDMGKDIAGTAGDTFAKTVQPVLEEEIKHAQFVPHDDGTYEIKTEHLRITGKKGDPKATVSYGKHTFQVNIQDLSERVQQQILQAENGQKQ
jgi:hypothetical protein